jgi:hypothetical protein
MYPWTPKEPWTAGHETTVAVGPKGLIVGATICCECSPRPTSAAAAAAAHAWCLVWGIAAGSRWRKACDAPFCPRS